MSLDPLLKPRSIAVVGASDNPKRIGGVPVDPVIVALRRQNLPYIFVSAWSGHDEFYRDGVFLSKPCTATDLIRAVNQMARK